MGPPPKRSGWDQRAPLITLACVAAILLALGVGVVIGRGNGTPAAKQGTTVISVKSPTAAYAPTTANTTATVASLPPSTSATIGEDWPAGTSGWSVELSTFAKAGATAAAIDSAKSLASAKGAPDVGVLNGDSHSGTPRNEYVIYSGLYATQKEAEAAQKTLVNKFPGALVLHVTPSGSSASGSSSSGVGGGTGAAGTQGLSQASSLSHLSGSSYEKASAKLPSTVGTGGSAPKTDNQKPGGGAAPSSCIGC